MFKKESKLKRFDFILLITTILLCIYGFIAINSATMSKATGSEPFLKTQIIAFGLGMVALFVLIFIDYDIYGSLYIPIYMLTNILLLYTLINPVEASEWGDVRSWIAIGPIVFQPSEIAKFGIIISLSKFIDIHKDNINQPLGVFNKNSFVSRSLCLISSMGRTSFNDAAMNLESLRLMAYFL